MFGNSFFPFKKASPTATSRGGQRPQGGGGASGASDPGAWPRAKELCPLPPSSLTLPSGQCLSGVCEGVLPGRQRGPRTRFVRVAAGRCHHGNRPRGPRPGLENAESTRAFPLGRPRRLIVACTLLLCLSIWHESGTRRGDLPSTRRAPARP